MGLSCCRKPGMGRLVVILGWSSDLSRVKQALTTEPIARRPGCYARTPAQQAPIGYGSTSCVMRRTYCADAC